MKPPPPTRAKTNKKPGRQSGTKAAMLAGAYLHADGNDLTLMVYGRGGDIRRNWTALARDIRTLAASVLSQVSE